VAYLSNGENSGEEEEASAARALSRRRGGAVGGGSTHQRWHAGGKLVRLYHGTR
jgi:hypothetical protein